MDPSGIEAGGEEPARRPSPSNTRDDSGFGPPTIAERVDDALVRLDQLRDRPLVVVVTAVAVVGLFAAAWWSARPVGGAPVEDLIPQVSLATPDSVTEVTTVDRVIVHVSGEVERPGVVSLPATARVLDAVEAAGGPTIDAELDRLNLAAPLVDGVQIRVPAFGEVLTQGEPVAGLDSSDDRPIDLNTASLGELERLDGVGPAIAEAIVEHREEHGPFSRVDDLLAVAGIGPAKLAAIADDAIVR